jgi:hypothetical protein
MKGLTLPVERPITRRQQLHDEIMGLPEALHESARIGIGGREFERSALDETNLEPASGNDVDHRELFRHPERVRAVGERYA